MNERTRKRLIWFNVIVGIIVVVQAIRFDERLLKPVASLIYNVSDWVEEFTGVKKRLEHEIKQKGQKENQHDTQGTEKH